MSFDPHTNFAYATVAVAPSPASSGTSLTVAAGLGALFAAVPANATVWPISLNALATNAEIVRVTARVGDVLTIVRAQEGTSARTILAGDQLAITITAKTLTDIEAAGVPPFTLANGDPLALNAALDEVMGVDANSNPLFQGGYQAGAVRLQMVLESYDTGDVDERGGRLLLTGFGLKIPVVQGGGTTGMDIFGGGESGVETNATADIGSGVDGTVTATYPGTAGNGYAIEVVVGPPDSALSVALVAGSVTVTLATDGLGDPINAENTAALVSGAINDEALARGFPIASEASGDGSASLTVAEGPTQFAGGITPVDGPISLAGGIPGRQTGSFGIALDGATVQSSPVSSGIAVVDAGELAIGRNRHFRLGHDNDLDSGTGPIALDDLYVIGFDNAYGSTDGVTEAFAFGALNGVQGGGSRLFTFGVSNTIDDGSNRMLLGFNGNLDVPGTDPIVGLGVSATPELRITAGAVTVNGTVIGPVTFPTSDPGIPGAWWNNAGTLVESV